MPTLLHPGVYVSEVPAGARSIEGAPTSTTIFVGETERGPLVPTKIKSRGDFERLYGGYFRVRDDDSPPADPTRVLTAYAIDGFYVNGGSTAYVLRAMDAPEGGPQTAGRGGLVEASSPGIWGHSVAVAFLDSSGPAEERFRIAVVYESPQTGERRLVETWDRLSTDPADENYVVDVLRRSLYIRWAADAVPAVPAPLDELGSPPSSSDPDESDIVGGAVALTGGAGGGGDLDAADYGLLLSEQLAGVDDAALLVAACDALLARATTAGEYGDFVDQFIGFAEGRPRRDLFFVGDLPSLRTQPDPTSATTAVVTEAGALTASNFAGLYWPHLVVGDVVGVGRNPTISLPPAGYVAGLFARIDGRRGVWKAPAGTEATLNATTALEHQLNDLHSDELNPRGVNALRQIPGAGRVVWGSRTMKPSSEWRYVPVRRTAIFLRTSISNGIQWAVFEPNDEPLWASLRASVGAFMETQFRNGAFAGRTSDEAYFVKVDAETTTEIDQAAGIVNILVGFAPLRPAEFVVVKLSQKTQSAA
ncbi:MAG TPA: phage tail sheath subtilisin-like domain-containing protein [Solirubrobacteraceae bacterium]|nr:phage tail sheath subtilisin-like domain-containing protein [Solirubrobacteraceae bacterium]